MKTYVFAENFPNLNYCTYKLPKYYIGIRDCSDSIEEHIWITDTPVKGTHQQLDLCGQEPSCIALLDGSPFGPFGPLQSYEM